MNKLDKSKVYAISWLETDVERLHFDRQWYVSSYRDASWNNDSPLMIIPVKHLEGYEILGEWKGAYAEYEKSI